MILLRFANDLLDGKLPPSIVKQAALVLFLFSAVAGALIVFSTPEMTTRESLYMGMVGEFAGAGRVEQLDYNTANKYVFSLPWRLSADSGLTVQVFAIRALGLVFLMLTLLLSWQTAKRLFQGDEHLSLLVLALLATNNRLITGAISIGGDAFTIFIFSVFVYFLIEVSAKGALPDLMIGLAVIFLISRLDFQMASTVLIPILSLATLAILLFTQRHEIASYLPKDNGARTAMFVGLVLISVGAARISAVSAAMLGAPPALWYAVTGLLSWPAIIGQIASYFSGSALLPEGFSGLQILQNYLFQVTAGLALAGLGALVSERVRFVKNADGVAIGASSSRGFNLTLVKPESSVLKEISLPALATMVFLPLTVLAAGDAYAGAAYIGDASLYLLMSPLAVLTVLGLRKASSLELFRTATLFCLAAILTLNVGGIMISIMWRQ